MFHKQKINPVEEVLANDGFKIPIVDFLNFIINFAGGFLTG